MGNRKLKVYGGSVFVRGKQLRAIVGAHSMREVAQITGASLYWISTWWVETGNDEEVKKATESPLTLIVVTPKEKVNDK